MIRSISGLIKLALVLAVVYGAFIVMSGRFHVYVGAHAPAAATTAPATAPAPSTPNASACHFEIDSIDGHQLHQPVLCINW